MWMATADREGIRQKLDGKTERILGNRQYPLEGASSRALIMLWLDKNKGLIHFWTMIIWYQKQELLFFEKSAKTKLDKIDSSNQRYELASFLLIWIQALRQWRYFLTEQDDFSSNLVNFNSNCQCYRSFEDCIGSVWLSVIVWHVRFCSWRFFHRDWQKTQKSESSTICLLFSSKYANFPVWLCFAICIDDKLQLSRTLKYETILSSSQNAND